MDKSKLVFLLENGKKNRCEWPTVNHSYVNESEKNLSEYL